MLFPLLFSSLIAGPLATLVMVTFQYLPRLWGGGHYDIINALGSAVTKDATKESARLGTYIHYGTGVLFAIFYGFIEWGPLSIQAELPQLLILGGRVNLFDVTIGCAIGLGHGLFVAILLAIVVIEHHPVDRFRSDFYVIPSAVIGHVAYGGAVMFIHSFILRSFFLG